MKTVLVPVFNQRVSSRLDCTQNFKVVKIDRKIIRDIEAVQFVAKNNLEKLNLILSLRPDTVICNGLTELYKNELTKNDVEVIPWIHGRFDEVINDFINGKLNSVE